MKWTEEQINNRKSDYVCFDCGIEFLSEEQKGKRCVVTAHFGTCCLCGEQDKTVTHIRTFNWLKFKKDVRNTSN